MFGDYQTSILRNIFSPLSVFFPTSSLKQTPELCLYSPQNLISFTPSALPHAPVGINLINISHFLNKAHIVVCWICSFGCLRSNDQRYAQAMKYGMFVARTCGRPVPQIRHGFQWVYLPAMFFSSFLHSWLSRWYSAAVQLGCRLCIGWDRGSSWVNLNMSVLWHAGRRMICYLNCVSSTLQDSHREAEFSTGSFLFSLSKLRNKQRIMWLEEWRPCNIRN